MKAPGYVFLLAEYVGRMEALLTYDKIPPEVKESMRQRAKELKAIHLTEKDINQLMNWTSCNIFKNPYLVSTSIIKHYLNPKIELCRHIHFKNALFLM